MSAIGDELNKIRGNKSVADMANDLGCHFNTLANYEKGKRLPDVDFLVTFANATGSDLSHLLRLLIESGSHQPKGRTVLDSLAELGISNRSAQQLTAPNPAHYHVSEPASNYQVQRNPDAAARPLNPSILRQALILAEDAAAIGPLTAEQRADMVLAFYQRLSAG